MRVGHFHNQPACLPHFPMQKTHGILFVVIGAKRVGADHFSQIAGLVREGPDFRPHLMDCDIKARLRRLPGGFGPGHAAADDIQFLSHGA